MFTPSLDRFRTAQAASPNGLANALAELAAGRKQSHWIWHIFPQLRGLGRSHASDFYGLEPPEAELYLADPDLRKGYLQALRSIHRHVVIGGQPVAVVLGSIVDAQKLVSSLTLFEAVAHRLERANPDPEQAELISLARALLAAAEKEGLRRCRFTDEQLKRAGWTQANSGHHRHQSTPTNY